MSFSPRYRHLRRRKRLLLLAIAVALLGLLVLFAIEFIFHRPASITNNPGVHFRGDSPPPRPVTIWPFYGFNTQRTRAVTTNSHLKPPFRRVWSNRGSILLEFPPVASSDMLFLLKNNGALHALDKTSGRARWKRKLGGLAASSPAYGEGMVFVTLLARKDTTNAGRVVALNDDGKMRWQLQLDSRSESSPLLHNGRIYFGTEGGEVFARKSATGKLAWKFTAGGAIKGGVALSDGRLFFGDYAGNFYCLKASDGKEIWQRQLQTFPYGSEFYSTPAVIYGRVYVGSSNGLLYALSEPTGKTAWARQTGDYLYSSPAAATIRGLGPTIFVGLRDGTFKALSAKTGRTHWKYSSDGRIIGSPAVIDNVVYFSNLGKRRTYGLDARTGKRLFNFPRGGFGGVISDGENLIVNGYSSIYSFAPEAKYELAGRDQPGSA